MAVTLEMSRFGWRRVAMVAILAIICLAWMFRAQLAVLFWIFLEALLLGPPQ